MSHTKRLFVLAGVAGSLGGASTALANTDTDEIRAVVAEMLAESDAKSSMLQGGQAGHDGGFFISDSTGDFTLEIGGQLQFRYIANFGSDNSSRMYDDLEHGFTARRTKLEFSGTVHEDWDYKIVGAFDRTGGSFILEDAWVSYDLNDNWTVAWGQFKAPLLREELVSSKHQLAVERSIVNEMFNQGRSQGIAATYSADQLKVMMSASDGAMTANTDFNDAGESDFAFTGRVEYLASGEWGAFKDFTSQQGDDFALLLGAAGHYQEMTLGRSSESNDPTDVEVTSFTYTVDASAEGDSWNAFGAFVGRYAEAEGPVSGGNPEVDGNDFGFVLQGGYRISENTEVFARYDAVILDDDSGFRPGIDEDFFQFLTIGVNHYYHGHAVKASADVVFSLDETSPDLTSGAFTGGFANDGAGLLGDDDSPEVAIRFQFQLLF